MTPNCSGVRERLGLNTKGAHVLFGLMSKTFPNKGTPFGRGIGVDMARPSRSVKPSKFSVVKSFEGGQLGTLCLIKCSESQLQRVLGRSEPAGPFISVLEP